MKPIKIVAIVLIISASLIGSYFIIRNPAKSSSSVSIDQSSANALNEKISQGLQQIKDQLTNQPSIEKPIQWTENNNPSDTLSDNNLTQNIGQDVFQQMQSVDFSKQSPANLPANFDLMTGGLTNDALQKQLSNFNLISDIDDSEIKISQDNSKEAKIKYLETIGEINKKDLGNFNKNYLAIIIDVFQKLDVSSASQLANIYKNLADDYLNLAVPSDWLDTHKKLIVHFKNSETIYQALAGYLDDPVKGYLALEVIQDSINNGQQVETFLEKEATEVGLIK